MTAWLYIFANNLKSKITKKEILLTPFVAVAGLRPAETF